MKKYLYLIKNSKIQTYLKYWLMYSSKKISLLIQSLPITLENTIKDLKIVINKIYGNSEQVQYSGKNLLNAEENLTFSGVKTINVSIPAGTYRLTFESQSHQGEENPYIRFDEANIGMDFDRTLDREIILNTDVSRVYLYSNGYNYVESQGISATINKLMVSVAGGDYEPYVRSEQQVLIQIIHKK